VSPPVLSLRGVGKCYSSFATNIERFVTWFGVQSTPRETFWAARDISFDVAAGQAVALVGENGAGKSTLLKMITGTVRPTTGSIAVSGHINAILELSIGFNGELTGRQNIYQGGGLMGMSGDELTGLMPHIEAFAEIGDFFDRPFRTYSSGMQARLAFALATARRPDLLIIDEILAVGDSYFQHKSFDRIRQFKDEGSAIILVTHALESVRALCDRVLLLSKGTVVKDGPPDEVVDYYNALMAAKENALLSVEQRRVKGGWLHTRSGSYAAVVSHVDLVDAGTRAPVATATVGQKLVLTLTVDAAEDIQTLVIGVMMRERTGHIVWGTNTWHSKQTMTAKAGDRVICEIAFDCDLGPGSYSVSTALTSSETHLSDNYEWQDNMLVFDVLNVDRPFFIGSTALEASITLTSGRTDGPA